MSKYLSQYGFRTWNKEELFNQIDKINIFRLEDQVITKLGDAVINVTNVSKRYEVFDIRSFMKSKIEQIEANFPINFYKFRLKAGVQELTLISDEVEINKTLFYKSFYILNSSDKSRRLNMNMGLYRADNNSYVVGSIRNLTLSTKHLTGVTKKAEEISQTIDIETFDEQIEAIKSLVGQRVLLSKVREIIVDKDLQINHRKFDALKNSLRYSPSDKMDTLTKDQLNTLCTTSETLVIDHKNDFSIDAYKIFNCYIQVFSRQDSYIVKKETEKILKITQCFLRDEKISSLLDLLLD
jgi:hypothetical protein